MQRTAFENGFLKTYQEQLDYLEELEGIGQDICKTKIKETQNSIMDAIVKEIK